ncbi:GNAT family N-acetyltransferase, partial [Azospirillum brasilense]
RTTRPSPSPSIPSSPPAADRYARKTTDRLKPGLRGEAMPDTDVLTADGDLERLRGFLAGMVRLNGGCPDTAVPGVADLLAWLAAAQSGRGGADRCWLIAERREDIVGHVRIGPGWPASSDSGALTLGIELHPDVRGFGLGRQIMLAAHRWAAGRCARLELAVLPHNARALALYHALGYVNLGPVALPETGEIHHRMAISLPAPCGPAGNSGRGVTLVS